MLTVNTINHRIIDKSKPVLYIISGPSGSGKTSNIRQVMNNEVVSFTTRPRRDGEVEGFDYVFTTVEEVDRMEASGELVERVTYDGNSYGISKDELYGKLATEDAFVVVDYHGFQQVRELYENYVSIFFSIDVEDARNRMLERGDKPEVIEGRLKTYETELKNQQHYDYVIQNEYGKQAETVQTLKDIIFGKNNQSKGA
ncbi:hypothetical protein JMA_42620 (plasmid) [Jeotgalibacillus malaysiensis]|uniref:Guanylate kinase-like domain-containing protein n=1 Tax=Jeotgalibacillus malaysiensis TaxID=1508404 RepID=A0A0B5B059_9BACL|nr:hypothetical protein [Jeotgalibacillus malaysiensis]AJD93579.1 hypothetical protein JMA_42620 [Jeotgalibacillus malaysiensis]